MRVEEGVSPQMLHFEQLAYVDASLSPYYVQNLVRRAVRQMDQVPIHHRSQMLDLHSIVRIRLSTRPLIQTLFFPEYCWLSFAHILVSWVSLRTASVSLEVTDMSSYVYVGEILLLSVNHPVLECSPDLCDEHPPCGILCWCAVKQLLARSGGSYIPMNSWRGSRFASVCPYVGCISPLAPFQIRPVSRQRKLNNNQGHNWHGQLATEWLALGGSMRDLGD